MGIRLKGDFLFIEKRVQRADALHRADALVTIERGKDFESVLEPIPGFLVNLHSEPLSQRLLVVDLSGVSEKDHLQAGHGAVVGLLVEKGIFVLEDGHVGILRKTPSIWKGVFNFS